MTESSYQQAKPGDLFDDGYSNVVEVTRQSRNAEWVDIAVVQPNGAAWTKRMPKGIPANWTRLSRG